MAQPPAREPSSPKRRHPRNPPPASADIREGDPDSRRDLGGQTFRELLLDLARGRGPADIVRESGNRISMPTASAHFGGRPLAQGMSNEIFDAYCDVLPVDPDVLWAAIGRSTGKRIRRRRSKFEDQLPPDLHRLDPYPRLRSAKAAELQALIDTIDELER